MRRLPPILSILLCGLILSIGPFALRGTAATVNSAPAANMPELFRNVGIDQELNHQVPLDLVFRDSTGKDVRLQSYFGQKPVILVLVYYSCPMLCTLVLNNLVHSLKDMKFNLGQQYEVVTVSFDPTETAELAAAKKAVYVTIYNRPGAAAGWHFLTGDEESIEELTQAVGFHYHYEAQIQQYIHATGIMILTPQGRIARYFYGVRYPADSLRLALVEASNGKIGSPVDKLRLYCSDYDPETGKYSLLISRVLKLSAVLTILGIAGLIIGLSVSTTQKDASGGSGM